MNGISVDWDALLDSSMRLTNNGETLHMLVESINSDITKAQDTWQGAASKAYQEQWATLLPQFKQAAENVKTMGIQIMNYVSAQQEIEQQAQGNYQG
jgi:WXG100 family type VII secretion target